MSIAKEGWPYAIGLAAAAAAAAFWSVALAGVFAALAAFVLFFFRDPERVVPAGEGLVVSPADGKVVRAEQRAEGVFVSIFLSIFNVHVNRAPIAGVIHDVRYRKGAFHAAFDARASPDNEQNVVTVRGPGHDVVFKQIAGLIARRIVFKKKLHDQVLRGERVGLIKFGSRVDIELPPGTRLRVAVGERVQAAASVIAELPRAARP
jgi:phosphatidylserine decarboxylase